MRQKERKLGQCFLEDAQILKMEARIADVAGKSVLEIGAGDGRLTIELHRAGASKIVAVEKDKKLAKKLRARFSSYNTIKVVEADFLEYAKEVGKIERVAGNIPYYITSPILFELAKMEFGKALLCVQKEFAMKMVAKPGDRNYGRLSVTSQAYFDAQIMGIVGREKFAPSPKVDSALVLLEKTGKTLDEYESGFVAALFSHKNKSVHAALVDARAFFGKSKAQMREMGASIKYNERRVNSLSVQEALELAGELRGK